MNRHDLLIATLSLLVGLIIAFYASIFLIGIDCNNEPETINLEGDKQTILEFKFTK